MSYAQSKSTVENDFDSVKALDNLRYSSSPRTNINICNKIIENEPKNGRAYYELAKAYKAMASFVVKDKKEIEHYRSLSIDNFKIAKELGYHVNKDKQFKGTTKGIWQNI